MPRLTLLGPRAKEEALLPTPRWRVGSKAVGTRGRCGHVPAKDRQRGEGGITLSAAILAVMAGSEGGVAVAGAVAGGRVERVQ